ncbi:hypothetical protein Vafri_4329 [Volvox africanus]|uniref:Uncharacterized protein n=1 Tax=Volvox africanus TaxID=51714 RepID=A0A8J4ATF0_9CHLO|nr:hypothetical protein Vafri_4329 [Volvox africanus]
MLLLPRTALPAAIRIQPTALPTEGSSAADHHLPRRAHYPCPVPGALPAPAQPKPGHPLASPAPSHPHWAPPPPRRSCAPPALPPPPRTALAPPRKLARRSAASAAIAPLQLPAALPL